MTYALRAIELLITSLTYWKTQKPYFSNDMFNQNLFRMTTKVLWDLPAIASTVMLNFGLIKDL